jgi:hypothetical protein
MFEILDLIKDVLKIRLSDFKLTMWILSIKTLIFEIKSRVYLILKWSGLDLAENPRGLSRGHCQILEPEFLKQASVVSARLLTPFISTRFSLTQPRSGSLVILNQYSWFLREVVKAGQKADESVKND